MSRENNIPTLVLHYYEYRDNFDLTVKKLLDFLEQPKVGKVVQFVGGKEYANYYSKKQKEAIYGFLQELSSRETWHHLKNYNFGIISKAESTF